RRSESCTCGGRKHRNTDKTEQKQLGGGNFRQIGFCPILLFRFDLMHSVYRPLSLSHAGDRGQRYRQPRIFDFRHRARSCYRSGVPDRRAPWKRSVLPVLSPIRSHSRLRASLRCPGIRAKLSLKSGYICSFCLKTFLLLRIGSVRFRSPHLI
ncbi:unnamed protein product, partial [Laminaria digitata]